MNFRVLITGSRKWTDRGRVERELERIIRSTTGVVTFVHGDCETGADRMVREYVERVDMRDVEQERHPANWYPRGPGTKPDRSAGPKRNAEMVALGADLCLAFWNGDREGSGTLDCFAQAVKAGIPVRIVPEKKR